MDKHDWPPIVELLPHGGAMVLLDRLLEVDGDLCACEAKVRGDALFGGGGGGLPAYVGVELMAQTIAAFSGYHNWRAGRPIEPGFLIGTPQWGSTAGEIPAGTRLRIEVRRVWGDSELMRFSCRVLALPAGETLQEGELNVFKPENIQAFLKASQ